MEIHRRHDNRIVRMALKVVIENAVLKGSQDDSMLQRVATVYPEGGGEFRVLAPPKATGDALDWLKQWQVRQPDRSL